jgi:hypothetical protein
MLTHCLQAMHVDSAMSDSARQIDIKATLEQYLVMCPQPKLDDCPLA